MKKKHLTILISTIMFAVLMTTSKVSYAETQQIKLENKNIAKYENDGHLYAVVDQNAESIDEMEKTCESLGAHIAYINDQKENDFIYNLIKQNGTKTMYALGVYRENENDIWKYFNNNDITYSNWSEGEPNNVATELNVHMYKTTGEWNNIANEGGKINSGYKIDNMGMVIEWDTNQEFKGHIYKVIENPLKDLGLKTVQEMKEYCEKLNGHLVYIDDADEQDFIKKKILHFGSKETYAIGNRYTSLSGKKYKDEPYSNWTSAKHDAEIEIYASINRANDKWNSIISNPTDKKLNIANMGMIIEWD